MKNHHIYFILVFTSILFFLNFTSCKKTHEVKQPEISGYFMINHVGEENKPIPYFIVKTNRDTTYLQIKKYWDGMSPLSIEFNTMEMREKNIEDCKITTYSEFKKIILEYNKKNKIKPSYEYGTFEIYLTDNIDTLIFTIGANEYAKSFFKDLEQVANENGLEKAANRFEEYKNMQPQ